jgi:hypothetical protein
MFFRNPKPEWKQPSTTHIDQIPDLTVEIVSPSNLGKKWEDNLAFYHQAGFPEFWLVQLDGAVEICRAAKPQMKAAYKLGELFSSPLFPGLAIDPAWIKNYPKEIMLIRKFSPQIRVLHDPDDAPLTKRARKLAARIAEHFGETYPPSLRSQTGPKGRTRRRTLITPEPPRREGERGHRPER